MSEAPLTTQQIARAYREQFDRLIDDAAFLWVRRSLAVDQPHYGLMDLRQLETRLENALVALAVMPEPSWEICEELLPGADAGEIFVASVLAFRSGDVGRIQRAVTAGLASTSTFPGVVSALGWLADDIAHHWINRFLCSKDLTHKYLGVAACSVRRSDPGNVLDEILQRPDCQLDSRLYTRALRLAGEIKRSDLDRAVRAAYQSADADVRFWSNWSATLLGDESAARALQSFLQRPNPHRERAVQLCLRVAPTSAANHWLDARAADPASASLAINAVAVRGDPARIPWLIEQMRTPELARLAGESFTRISGIDLQRHNLALEPVPVASQPNDDPDDDDVAMDEDRDLPFPDAAAVEAIWQRYGSAFEPGRRYLAGNPIDLTQVKHVYVNGCQRERAAAALEWALLQPQQHLPNHATARGQQ